MRISAFIICLLLVTNAVSGEDDSEPTNVDYLPLSPKFVVNLQGGQRTFIRADIQLMLEGTEHVESIKTHLPAIRHGLIMLFSEHSADQIHSAEQREELRQKALDETRAAVGKYVQENQIQDLFFTEFLVQ